MPDSGSSSQKPRKRTSRSSPNGGGSRAKSTSSRPKQASRSKAAAQAKPTARSSSRSSSGKDAAGQADAPAGAAKGAATAAKETAAKAAGPVKETAAKAAGPVKETAAKAKGPAIAIGAAAAGVAGGVLLRSRTARRKRVLGVPVPRSLGGGSHMPGLDMKSIAKNVGDASQTFAKTSKAITRDLERASDQAERIGEILSGGHRDDGGNRRSPVEILLDGLTHRRGADRRRD